MVSAALKDGTAGRQCVFEVFARRLPTGRRYGVVAGSGRLMELIRGSRFTEEDIDFLRETLLLSVLNHDCAVASGAARMVTAARGRPMIEMGSRRTHEDAAVAAARAAYLAGFSATSNLEAERRHGIPTAGTAAHAFTLLHDDELSAFRSQIDALGAGTTLLVDTY